MITKSMLIEQIEHLELSIAPQLRELINDFEEYQLSNRRNFTGHITASSLIVHLPTREVLLLHHKGIDKWLIPGGHIEPEDQTLGDAARREAGEETGINPEELFTMNTMNIKHYCIEIDSHLIPRNDPKDEEAHYHHDFRFLFGYKGEKEITIVSEESLDYRWMALTSPECQPLSDSLMKTANKLFDKGVECENKKEFDDAKELFENALDIFELDGIDSYYKTAWVIEKILNLTYFHFSKHNIYERLAKLHERMFQQDIEHTTISSLFAEAQYNWWIEAVNHQYLHAMREAYLDILRAKKLYGKHYDKKYVKKIDKELGRAIKACDDIDNDTKPNIKLYNLYKCLAKENPRYECRIPDYQFRLANHYINNGQTEEAEELYKEVVETYKNTYDDLYEISPSILSALWNLALLYEETGQREKAIATHRLGLYYCEELTFGDNDEFEPDRVRFQRRLDALCAIISD